MKPTEKPDAADICFGLNKETDEKSLIIFLQLFAQKQLLETIIPRLDPQEQEDLVDQLSRLMHNHLNKQEYERLFLNDNRVKNDDKTAEPS